MTNLSNRVLTTEQIHEINALTAEKIMGWERAIQINATFDESSKSPFAWVTEDGTCITDTEYSPYTNLDQAVWAMRKRIQPGIRTTFDFRGNEYVVDITNCSENAPVATGKGPTVAAALTLALLKWDGVDVLKFE